MKYIINFLSESLADALYLAQVFHAGPGNSLQATELSQQLLAPFGSKAWNVFQRRGLPFLAASQTMTVNGKAVGLVTNMLNQM